MEKNIIIPLESKLIHDSISEILSKDNLILTEFILNGKNYYSPFNDNNDKCSELTSISVRCKTSDDDLSYIERYIHVDEIKDVIYNHINDKTLVIDYIIVTSLKSLDLPYDFKIRVVCFKSKLKSIIIPIKNWIFKLFKGRLKFIIASILRLSHKKYFRHSAE